MSVEFIWFVTLGSICHGVHLGQERWCVVWNFWAPKPAQVRLILVSLLQGYSNPFNNSNRGLQQFKGISITTSNPGAFEPGFDTVMNSYLCSCSGLPLSTHWYPWGCIYSTWNLIYEPQPLPGVYLLWCTLTHRHSYLRVLLFPMGHNWHLHNWDGPALVWTSTEAAAVLPWPPASPAASLLLLSECSQAQQSTMTSHRTAHSESKKQPLTSTGLKYPVGEASPMASTGVCQLIANQQ